MKRNPIANILYAIRANGYTVQQAADLYGYERNELYAKIKASGRTDALRTRGRPVSVAADDAYKWWMTKKCSVAEAARKFNVNYHTLYNRVLQYRRLMGA